MGTTTVKKWLLTFCLEQFLTLYDTLWDNMLFWAFLLLFILLCWLQKYCQILHGELWQKVHMINQDAK